MTQLSEPSSLVTGHPRPQRPTLVTRIIRQFLPLALFAAVLAALVRIASRPLDNPDTYFHLRFGHEFLRSWSLSDPGSVTPYATADWLPTQWLPQVIMARTEDTLGLAGVAWLSGLQMVGLVLTFYLVARRWADPLPAVVVVIGAALACGPSLSMRPQVLSFVFVAIIGHLWLRAPTTTRLPWATVPLTWLWAMTHGMWPVGILIGLVAATAWSLDEQASIKTALTRLSVPTSAAVVAALTPVGPAVYGAVLSVGSRSEYFAEWQPPDFTNPNALALGVMLALSVTTAMRGVPSSWLTTGLVLLTAGFSVYSLRTVPVAAALLVPILSSGLQRAVGSWNPPRRREVASVVLLASASLGVLGMVVPHTAAVPPGQPAWVDRELVPLPAGTAVLNEWGWGGYLMWRYPGLHLVMHGYGDTFTTAELDRNKDISELVPGWEDRVEDLQVDYALLPPDSPLAYALAEHAGWRVIRVSDDVELLEAPPRPR